MSIRDAERAGRAPEPTGARSLLQRDALVALFAAHLRDVLKSCAAGIPGYAIGGHVTRERLRLRHALKARA